MKNNHKTLCKLGFFAILLLVSGASSVAQNPNPTQRQNSERQPSSQQSFKLTPTPVYSGSSLLDPQVAESQDEKKTRQETTDETKLVLGGFEGKVVYVPFSLEEEEEDDELHIGAGFTDMPIEGQTGAPGAGNNIEGCKLFRSAAKKYLTNTGAFVPYEDVVNELKAAVASFKKAAEAGNASACCNLANCYYYGIGVAKNDNEAVKWYMKAKDRDARAFRGLGSCFLNGYGVAADVKTALQLYQKGLVAGDGRAGNPLGLYQLDQNDAQNAVAAFQKGSELGSGTAYNNLGVCYQRGFGVPKSDTEQAFILFQSGARLKSGIAWYNLGRSYLKGMGTKEDPEKAFRCFKKSAEEGYSKACVQLAICYQNGRGVAVDPVEALNWLQKGAEMNNAEACGYYGACWLYGFSGEFDFEKAVKWLRKAAALGNGDACSHLGNYFLSGSNVKVDEQKAVEWFQLGVELQSGEACDDLARCYEEGIGVPKDLQKARTIRLQGLKYGSASSYGYLGLCYNTGNGVTRNPEEAARLMKRANQLFEEGLFSQDKFTLAAAAPAGVPDISVSSDLHIGFGFSEKLETSGDAGTGAASNKEGLLLYQSAKERFLKDTGDDIPFKLIEEELLKAIEAFRHGADMGDGAACFNLATCYYHGTGVAENLAKSVELYEKAIKLGSVYAYRGLGRCYETGNGVDQNQEKAFELYQEGSRHGDLIAERLVGECYVTGTGVEKDVEKGVRILLTRADAGDATACLDVALLDTADADVEQDAIRRRAYFQESLSFNSPEALTLVAQSCYDELPSYAPESWSTPQLAPSPSSVDLSPSYTKDDSFFNTGQITDDAQHSGESPTTDPASDATNEEPEEPGAPSGVRPETKKFIRDAVGKSAALDRETALQYALKAAEMGSGEACAFLGSFFQSDENKHEVAKRYFQRAYKIGWPIGAEAYVLYEDQLPVPEEEEQDSPLKENATFNLNGYGTMEDPRPFAIYPPALLLESAGYDAYERAFQTFTEERLDDRSIRSIIANLEEARAAFKANIDKDPNACYNAAADLLLTSTDDESAWETGTTLLQKAARVGLIQAKIDLAVARALRNPTAQSSQQSVDELKEYFETDAEAGVKLGAMLLYGIGVQADPAAALEYFQKASERGSGSACSYLGDFYRFGNFVEQDDQKAKAFYQTGIGRGAMNACSRLADLYIENEEDPSNPYDVIRTLKKGTELGDARCCFLLGQSHLEGKYPPPDPVQGIELLLKGAILGDVESCRSLSECYNEGIGVKRNTTEAVRWSQLADRLQNNLSVEETPTPVSVENAAPPESSGNLTPPVKTNDATEEPSSRSGAPRPSAIRFREPKRPAL